MSYSYDDAKYRVITRKWFGLTKKAGGDCADGYGGTGFWGTTDATSATLLARWYPQGPIKIIKAGAMVLATMTQASSDKLPIYLKVRGGSASAGCTFYPKNTSTAAAPWAIASTTTFTVSQVKAGEYIYFRCGTAVTDKGTAANTASCTGTIALFIDYVPMYSEKWED